MDATSAEQLFGEIDSAAEATRFSGVVSIRLGPKLGFERAYGDADRANRIANTMETRFGTASVTKGFTALCACALIEQGRLALDTPVIDVLEVELPHVSREVTVQHLLTHTSGIGDHYDEDVVTDFDDFHLSVPWYELEQPSDYLPLFAELPAKFTPGERFSYSNSGFLLLGLVAEEVAGLPYHELVQERIFEPAGMSDSGFYRLDELPGSTALGYLETADGSPRTNLYNLPVVGGPDGGAFTTAGNMDRFWSALHSDLIVGPQWRERFLAKRVSAGKPNQFYGLGVWIYQRPGSPPFHFLEGADAGVRFSSLCGQEAEIEYTVACNSPPGGDQIVAVLDQAILGIDAA